MMKGAIFDVDGTLIDSMEIWEDVGIRYLKKKGILAEPELSQILFPMTVEEGADFLKKQYQLPEKVGQIVAGILGTVRDFYFYEAPLKRGAAEFLEALSCKKIPMVAATSSEWEHIAAAFERLNISKYFHKIYTCKEVGAGKSRPLIYQKAARYIGTRPQETYVFEDVLHAIKTAKEAGFHTVGVYDRYSEAETERIQELADIYLKDLTKFENFWKSASK